MEDKEFIVGVYDGQYNNLLGIDLPKLNIVQSEGLQKHILKRHPNCIIYLDKIKEILQFPDYVGNNPKETNSFELVKCYDDNILIGIKMDVKNNHYYVATLFDINQSKIDNRIYSGRLKHMARNPISFS